MRGDYRHGRGRHAGYADASPTVRGRRRPHFSTTLARQPGKALVAEALRDRAALEGLHTLEPLALAADVTIVTYLEKTTLRSSAVNAAKISGASAAAPSGRASGRCSSWNSVVGAVDLDPGGRADALALGRARIDSCAAQRLDGGADAAVARHRRAVVLVGDQAEPPAVRGEARQDRVDAEQEPVLLPAT
jgi:hypothetical protein